MKKIISFIVACLLACCVRAQKPTILYNPLIQGSGGQIQSGSTLTFDSGSTFDFQIGGATTNQLLYVSNSSGTVLPLSLGSGLSISGGTLVSGSSTSANPTAKVGTAVVNGSATSFMRSDAAPPIDLTMVPTWTGLHTFSITSTITAGSDYGLKITPTLNQRNATNFDMLYGNETVTQAGTGTQNLIHLQVGSVDKWVVDSTGTVKSGAWNGSVIGSAYGGAGTVNGVLESDGTGTVGSTIAGTGISITSSPNTISLASIASGDVLSNISGVSAAPTANTLTAILDNVFGNTQGDILYRDTSAWNVLAPGTSGKFLETQGSGSNPIWGTPVSGPATTTTHDVATYSNTTGGFEDNGMANFTTTVASFTANNSSGMIAVTENQDSANTVIETMYAPNQTSGHRDGMLIGQGGSGNNSFFLSFKYNGNGSSSNVLSIAPFGGSDTWTTDTAGNTTQKGIETNYNNISTAGIGHVTIYSAPRSTAQTAAVSLASYTVGGSDSTFEVSANVNLTAATTCSFTVTCTYTDETNTSRVLTLGFTQLSGATLLSTITNVTGTGPYEGIPYHIRCKAGTTIQFATTGTFTSVTYNVEGIVKQES